MSPTKPAKRQHGDRKPVAEAKRELTQAERVQLALAADVGPLAITITGNLVTGKVQVLDNSETELHLRILMEWLDSARGYLQGKLLQAAEARGRAAAAATPPPAPPPAP